MNLKTIIKSFVRKVKKHLYATSAFSLLAVCFIAASIIAHAASIEGSVNDLGCRIRTSPINGSIIVEVSTGFPVTVVEQAKQSDNYVWYKVRFSQGNEIKEGWIRSDLVTLKTEASTDKSDAAFEAKMEAEKFPESYRVLLRTLHKKHPNWDFRAMQTGLNWNDVIAGEIAVTMRNLVPATSPNSWKSLAPGAYDWAADEWYNYEAGWVAASQSIIEYCMDPRNFLVDNNRILMFWSLSRSASETADGVKAILSGTPMNTDAFAGYFMKAAEASNVSAYHLASRAVQETGGVSGSVTGTIDGVHYYNYYNIGAFAHDGLDPVEAALYYAREKGWTTPEKSIVEGAKFIGKNYINIGQDTLYLQKFDLIAADGLYDHQYMGNLLAPQHEASNLTSVMTSLGSSTITFSIPVFNNMPNEPLPQPTADGNPNSYLSEIKVDGYSLTPRFTEGVMAYDIIVPTKTSSVNVLATPMVSSSKVTGTGNINLNASGTTTVKITVTPSYGGNRVYTLYIAKSGSASGPSPAPDSTVALGDVNGDNKKNISDAVIIMKQIVGLVNLTDAQKKAADVNKDGKINISDAVLVMKHIVGLIQL